MENSAIALAEEPQLEPIETCPICIEVKPHKQELAKLQRVYMKLNTRKKAVESIPVNQQKLLNTLEHLDSCNINGKYMLTKKQLKSHVQNAKHYIHMIKQATKTIRKHGRLNTAEESEYKRLGIMVKDKKKDVNQIMGKHPRCAACSILLGTGHIISEYVIVDKNYFCPTCPKEVWYYTNTTERRISRRK